MLRSHDVWNANIDYAAQVNWNSAKGAPILWRMVHSN